MPVIDALLATDRGVHAVATVGEAPPGARQAAAMLTNRQVRDLTTGDEGWWALAGDHELWRAPHGGSPEHVATLSGPAATCVLPVPDKVLVGTEEARLLAWDGQAVTSLRGFDEAETRSSWYTPWGGPPAVRSLAVADDGAVYVNVHVGGILRSDDGGASWRATIDVEADVHEVATAAGRPETVVAATARGLAVSRDRGATWQVTDAGLHATYCRAVAVSGDTVYLSASTGPSSNSAALYRGDLDGEVLVRCTDGLPDWFASNVDSRCVAARDDSAVLGTAEGEAYASTDSGRTWARLAAGLPAVRAVTLA